MPMSKRGVSLKLEIIVGKTAGFCYGVERAVEGAIEEISESDTPIYCLGEIVHNRQVIQKLKDLGVKCVEKIEEVKGTALIRAHGIPKEVYDIAKEMNIKVRDFTCPNVLKVQKIAEKFNKDGYFIFLLGDKSHPENIATLSHCGKDYCTIEKEDDVIDAMHVFENTKKKKLLLISQTTFSLEKFNQFQKMIETKLQEDIVFVVKNTICRTTELRQKETEELSKKVDTMIIIGGKNSSNTKKLYEIAKKNCDDTILIETVEELQIEDSISKVGIMAGASTPKESIEEVIEFLKRRSI